MDHPTPSTRMRSLDGLRGWAAVVVFVSHLALTLPVLSDVVYGNVGPEDVSPLEIAVSYTPLHLIWAGQEAVYLFFILSGFVLAIPVIRAGRTFSWLAYYPRRIIRLYGPVIAAVVFGVLTVLIVARDQTGLSAWLDTRPTEPTLVGVIRDITLVFGPSGLISPLWSLRWEVIFSILLPVYMLAASKVPKLDWLKVAVLLGAMAFGVVIDKPYFVYLPMFAFGTLAATNYAAIQSFASRLRPGIWIVVVLLGCCLATSRWWFNLIADPSFSSSASILPGFLGCATLVFVGAFWRPAVTALETPASQWLGKVSFSLYLTHEPIIIAGAFLFGATSPWLVPLVCLPTALLVAWAFYRWAEAPFHSLARRVGRTRKTLAGDPV